MDSAPDRLLQFDTGLDSATAAEVDDWAEDRVLNGGEDLGNP